MEKLKFVSLLIYSTMFSYGGKKLLFLKIFNIGKCNRSFTQSDNYSGETLINIRAGSIIIPGVILAERTSIGVLSLILNLTEPRYILVLQLTD